MPSERSILRLDDVGTQMWTLLARRGNTEAVIQELLAVCPSQRYNIVNRFLDADRTADVLSDKAPGSDD